MKIEDFLVERLKESLDGFKLMTNDSLALMTYSNIVQNMLYAVDWHNTFPILVTDEPKLEFDAGVDGLDTLTYRMTQQIEWYTQEEYRKKFGNEPPTAPLLRAWAQQFAWHSDFQEEWLITEDDIKAAPE
jgi:hypothetical protein